MSISYRKDKMFEAQDSSRLYIPEQFGQRQDPPRISNDLLEQWPTDHGEPIVSVGIMSCSRVTVSFQGSYLCTESSERLDNQQITIRACDLQHELNYQSLNPSDCFTIDDVTIGIGFHWQRRESQSFVGNLSIKRDGEQIVVINILPVEDYLHSVIASEMSATADVEFLRAHAIMSRSWLLRIKQREQPSAGCSESREEIVRWAEHDAHTLFDVCADDHCQRYQGIGRAHTPAVDEAIRSTRGTVLMHNGEICDARFSKCCGGRTERFSTAWADRDVEYLRPVDCPHCDTHDSEILARVLNSYDRETRDFHDWTVEYTVQELSELVARKSGIDFGTITSLEPLARGASGRIYRLRVTGTKRSIIVGKELEIRRCLAESHLYSSCFTVEQTADRFILHGHGWGHGVGLCQIGAAVMAAKGASAEQILQHYFTGATLAKLYD